MTALERSSSRFSLRDIPAALVLAAGLAGLAALPRLYRPSSSSSFPRQSSDFLAPAALDRIESSAKADLQKNPEDLAALAALAAAAFQRGPERALECIEHGQRALDLGALDDRLFYYTGLSYETKGLNEYAVSALEKFLRHRPGDMEVRLRLGNLYYRLGELEKAQEAFKEVLASRPGDSLVSFNLAMALRDRQQWREGLEVLEPVLDRDKTLPAGGFRLLGDLRRGAGDPDGALGAYRREIERSPDDADLMAAAAQAHEDAGRPEDALATWRRVLDLDSKNNQAYKKIRALKRKTRR